MSEFQLSVNGARFNVGGRVPDGFAVWASLHDGIQFAKEGYWSCPLYLWPEFERTFSRRLDAANRTAMEQRLSLDYLSDPQRTFPKFLLDLKPHQQVGSRFILNRTRCFLLDEMGAMKTKTLLEVALQLLRLKKIERVLVVVTASGRATWLKELRKWGFDEQTGTWHIPEFQKHVLLSAPYATIPAKLDSDALFAISSFEVFSHSPYDETLGVGVKAILDDSRRRKYFLVVDEAHRIGNSQAERTRNLRNVKSNWRVAMTGTPIGNRAEEVFALQSFVEGHEAWGGYEHFAQTFLVKQPQRLSNGKTIFPTVGYKNLDRLAASIVPLSIRRLKSQIAPDMPPIVWEDRVCDLSPKETEMYRILHAAFEKEVTQFREGSRLARELEMGAYTVCKQFLAHPQLLSTSASDLGREIYQKFVHGETEVPTGTKFEDFLELAEDIVTGSTDKAVVFCESPQVVAWMGERLPMGAWVAIHGGTSEHDREVAMERFNSDPTCRFFLSTDAGSESLNLPADYAIHYTLPWSLTKLNQRTQRCHRMDVQIQVTSVRMLAETEDSMDRVIEGILAKKADLAKQLLGPVEKASQIPVQRTL